MTNAFSVRQATPGDLETLLELRLEFLREVNGSEFRDAAELRANLRGYFEEHLPAGTFLAWLAENAGKIVGTSGLVFFHRPPSFNNATGLDAYIMNMYTLPAWRGRGVATALLHRVIEHVKTTPCRRICLHATPQGRPIYQRAGFKECDEEMNLLL